MGVVDGYCSYHSLTRDDKYLEKEATSVIPLLCTLESVQTMRVTGSPLRRTGSYGSRQLQVRAVAGPMATPGRA